MADLDELDREVRPRPHGTFAIAGASLIDGTGAPPIEDFVVVVRDGNIAAVGAQSTVSACRRQVDPRGGASVLPGLWEMHTHYSGVEFGRDPLAAGVTTARDCGGEFGFLTALRGTTPSIMRSARRSSCWPDAYSGGPLAFGRVAAETPAEGGAVVDRYADAGFPQIKMYDLLTPDVLRPATAEAHRRGLTVTGHVPPAIDAFRSKASRTAWT